MKKIIILVLSAFLISCTGQKQVYVDVTLRIEKINGNIDTIIVNRPYYNEDLNLRINAGDGIYGLYDNNGIIKYGVIDFKILNTGFEIAN